MTRPPPTAVPTPPGDAAAEPEWDTANKGQIPCMNMWLALRKGALNQTR